MTWYVVCHASDIEDKQYRGNDAALRHPSVSFNPVILSVVSLYLNRWWVFSYLCLLISLFWFVRHGWYALLREVVHWMPSEHDTLCELWESGLPLIQGILLTSAVLYASALYHDITWLQLCPTKNVDLYSVNIFVHLPWRIGEYVMVTYSAQNFDRFW